MDIVCEQRPKCALKLLFPSSSNLANQKLKNEVINNKVMSDSKIYRTFQGYVFKNRLKEL
jgi:hypothetical protein